MQIQNTFVEIDNKMVCDNTKLKIVTVCTETLIHKMNTVDKITLSLSYLPAIVAGIWELQKMIDDNPKTEALRIFELAYAVFSGEIWQSILREIHCLAFGPFGLARNGPHGFGSDPSLLGWLYSRFFFEAQVISTVIFSKCTT